MEEKEESVLPPSRLWKAGILDLLNLLPKIMPEVKASAQFLKGDGGVGSIRQLNFTPGLPIAWVIITMILKY